MSLRRHLELARQALAHSPAGALEAEILLAHALESPRSFLYAHPDMELPPHRFERFRKYLERRGNGEPIAYITGHREFWSLNLRITPDVLIPRHETEVLVEAALGKVAEDATLRIADLGTGSGAIALAIGRERPDCDIHATELSEAAAALATENARTLNINNVEIHQGSWCQPLQGRFSIIVSNPPYVAADDPHLDRGDSRFEPGLALTPGKDAMVAIREICDQARDYLQADGWLMLEHGSTQGNEVRQLMRTSGFADVASLHDLAMHERITHGRWPASRERTGKQETV